MTVIGPNQKHVVLVVTWDELDMLHTGIGSYVSDYESTRPDVNVERGIPLARTLEHELLNALGSRVLT